MDREFGMRRWAVVVLGLLAAVAIGATAYQAGVERGLAVQPPAASAPSAPGAPGVAQVPPPPYPYYAYRYYGPRRFGFFGPLFALLAFFFILRMVMWGVFGWGWRRRRWHEYADNGPSRFEEWHRQAHERMRGDA
jgi:hypothetical protein